MIAKITSFSPEMARLVQVIHVAQFPVSMFICLSLSVDIDLPTGSPHDVQMGAVQALLSNSSTEVLLPRYDCSVCLIGSNYLVSKQSIGVFQNCDQRSSGLLSEILFWPMWKCHY